VVAESAARLCEADDAIIRRLDGNVMPLVPLWADSTGGMDALTVSPRCCGRAIIGRQPIHLHDLAAAEVANEFPDSKFAKSVVGARTFLTMPMLREGTPVGVINHKATRGPSFSEKHIALLKTFADPAVIAIGTCGCSRIAGTNVISPKLWNSRQRRARFSASLPARPTDVQPVLDVVAKCGTVCEAADATFTVLRVMAIALWPLTDLWLSRTRYS